MATFSPSMKPASFKPWRNARRREVSVDDGWSKPTTGIAGCCATAASGQAAAAPPSSVMNSRRFMGGGPHVGGRTIPRRCLKKAAVHRSKIEYQMEEMGYFVG